MILMVTLALMPQMFRGGASAFTPQSEFAGTSRGGDRAAFAVAPPPTISISIEPAALAPHVEAGSPVVFPGYLLPDDSSEERAHAGS